MACFLFATTSSPALGPTQLGSGTHPAPYPMDIEGSYPGNEEGRV